MNGLDVLQQAINAAKPAKIVALRARREYRRLKLEEKMNEVARLRKWDEAYNNAHCNQYDSSVMKLLHK